MAATTTSATNITANIINNNNNNNNSHINDNLTSMIEDGELVQGQQALAAAMSILADQISQTKLIASLVLFLITLLCGYLPVRIIVNQNYIQHAMFAGGGVLMATAFCHLIPEAHDSYKAISVDSHHHHHQHLHQHNNNNHNHQHNHDQDQLIQTNASQFALAPSLHNQTQQALSAAATTISNDLETLISDESTTSGLGDGSFMAKINGLNVPYLEMTLCCGFFFMYLVEQLMLRFINNHSHEHPCDTGSGQLIIGASTQGQHNAGPGTTGASLGGDSNFIGGGGPGTGASSAAGSTSVGNLSTAIITPSSLHHGSAGATELYKFIRGLLIVSAFGTHSIFDGVAIGSQDSVERVWAIFIAISCHKLIIAAVVGLELFAATLESHLWTLVHLIIFSIMSPIGILLVVVAQNSFNINSNHPAMILLQSFATGTLLYIIFVEILQPKEDQYHTKNRLGQSFSLIAGFALMLTVLTLIDH